jgi:hypothetical protein
MSHAFLEAVRAGDLDTVRRMIDDGVDVNFVDYPTGEMGALADAARVVEAGADVNERAFGLDQSALDIAVERNHTPVAHYLWPVCSQETRELAGLPDDPRNAEA